MSENGAVAANLKYDPTNLDCGGGMHCGGLTEGRYITEDIIRVEEGALYEIRVEAPEFPSVRSEAVFAQRKLRDVKLQIDVTDSMEFRQFRVVDTLDEFERRLVGVARLDSVKVAFKATPEPGNRVMLEVYNNRSGAKYRIPAGGGWFSRSNGDPVDYTDLSVVNATYGNPFYEESIFTQYSFVVDLIRYPPEYQAFFDAVRSSSGQEITGIYAPSVQPIPTNMIGGYGYFFILERYSAEHVVQ